MSDPLLDRLLQAIQNGEQVALLTVVRAGGKYADAVGNRCILWQSPAGKVEGDLGLDNLTEQVHADSVQALSARQPKLLEYATESGQAQVFVEVQRRPPRLIIVGAGHIAVPLAQMASICDFHVTVMDDRRQFANAERFPAADVVIAGALTPELRRIREDGPGYDQDTYVVLVTRGHQYDMDSLVELIDDPRAYIGMIGSQRRIQAVFQLLESEKGIPPERFDNVYAPIGLDIGAHTPAEIAVCIMAEIINVMRGGPAVSMSEQLRQQREHRRAALHRQ